MGCCSSESSDEKAKSKRGCCPCSFKSACRGKIAGAEMEFYVEGDIPSEVNSISCDIEGQRRKLKRAREPKDKDSLKVPHKQTKIRVNRV